MKRKLISSIALAAALPALAHLDQVHLFRDPATDTYIEAVGMDAARALYGANTNLEYMLDFDEIDGGYHVAVQDLSAFSKEVPYSNVQYVVTLQDTSGLRRDKGFVVGVTLNELRMLENIFWALTPHPGRPHEWTPEGTTFSIPVMDDSFGEFADIGKIRAQYGTRRYVTKDGTYLDLDPANPLWERFNWLELGVLGRAKPSMLRSRGIYYFPNDIGFAPQINDDAVFLFVEGGKRIHVPARHIKAFCKSRPDAIYVVGFAISKLILEVPVARARNVSFLEYESADDLLKKTNGKP